MSLASCPKCWDDICFCGYQYEHFSVKEKIALCAKIIKVPEDELRELYELYNIV